MIGRRQLRAGMGVLAVTLASALVLVLVSAVPVTHAAGWDGGTIGPVVPAADGGDGGGVLAFLSTGLIVIAVAGLSTYAIRAAARRKEPGPGDPGPRGTGPKDPGQKGPGPKGPDARKHNRSRRQRR